MWFTLTTLSLILCASTAFAGGASGENANKSGVAWKKTWAEALEEAKLRNAPIHVSWHKDG